jgi:hypothetical protein
VVALESHENGLLNFLVEDGWVEGEGTRSGAEAGGAIPLCCNDAVETVDADALCVPGTGATGN